MDAKDFERLKYMILVGIPAMVSLIFLCVHLIFHNFEQKRTKTPDTEIVAPVEEAPTDPTPIAG